jgi:amino acid transporter
MWSTDGAHPGDTPVARPKSTTSDLVRALGQLDSTMIVVGILIGSGIFIVSAESARLVGATGWLLVVWVLAGLLTITGCQCGAELAARLPRAGGQYVFLREAYGPGSAFLFGWALFLIIQTGKIAAVAVAFATPDPLGTRMEEASVTVLRSYAQRLLHRHAAASATDWSGSVGMR